MPKLKAKVKRQKSKFSRSLSNRLLNPKIARSLFGILFVILGFTFLFTLPTIPQNNLSAKEPIIAGKEFVGSEKESQVVRIMVPENNIDLEVKPARIAKGYWETSETSASHGEGSANPGERGNIVVFAHAREGMFYNLKDIKKDDVIYIFTSDRWYRYKVSEVRTVLPNNIETVGKTDQEVLTLNTCSGFFDEKRLIVKADQIG